MVPLTKNLLGALYNLEVIQKEVPFRFFFGELQIFGFDLIFEFGYPVNDIVLARVIDEKIILHIY
jgi:hypothetical protein